MKSMKSRKSGKSGKWDGGGEKRAQAEEDRRKAAAKRHARGEILGKRVTTALWCNNYTKAQDRQYTLVVYFYYYLRPRGSRHN